MNTPSLCFEHPLNERIRTLLRLEYLFQQLNHFMQNLNPEHSHVALTTLAQLLIVLERPDVKSELLKEIERQQLLLKRWLDTPDVDTNKLNNLIETLNQYAKEIQAMPPKIGQSIIKSDFLNSLRQRVLIPGGTSHFDMPHYYLWLQSSLEHKQRDLTEWFSKLQPIEAMVSFLLSLVRESGQDQVAKADSGCFQKTFDKTSQHQLLQVRLDSKAQVFPEFSGNKHCALIRFLENNSSSRPQQTETTVEFNLTIC